MQPSHPTKLLFLETPREREGEGEGERSLKKRRSRVLLKPEIFSFSSHTLSRIPLSPAQPSSWFVVKLLSMVLWVFGYGSLMWNPGFNFDKRIVGYIRDYRRVFDLACIDHRGTPEHPARTCTLESKKGAICWGAAYCVKGSIEKERATMQYLERRECEYDLKSSADFYKEGDDLKPAVTRVLVFISTPDKEANRYYLGPAPLEEMARQIATSSGPCGNNRDYLFFLEKAMFSIGHEDDYVIELANKVREVLRRLKEKKKAGLHVPFKPHHHPLMQLTPLLETTVADSQ